MFRTVWRDEKEKQLQTSIVNFFKARIYFSYFLHSQGQVLLLAQNMFSININHYYYGLKSTACEYNNESNITKREFYKCVELLWTIEAWPLPLQLFSLVYIQVCVWNGFISI